MKKNTYKAILVVLSLFITSMSQAQLLEIVGGYLVNDALARGKQDEKAAGKIVFNVSFIDSFGREIQLPGWDPSTTLAVSWPDNVILEPVLIINSSRSPYEVQWALSDSGGSVVKQAYLKNKGGRRGKDGQAVDNGGYRHPTPRYLVGDLEDGWIAIHASWGKGESATAQFQNYDVSALMRTVSNPEALKAMALANGATTPSVPVFNAIMPDGQIRHFTSQEEVQLALQQQDPPAMQEGTGFAGQDFEIQRSAPEIDNRSSHASGLELRVYRYGDEDRSRGTTEEVLANLARHASMEKPLAFDTNTIPIPSNGDGIAILLQSYEKMEVEYRGDDGRKPYTVAELQLPDGQVMYSCLVTLTLSRGEKPTGKLLILGENSKTIYGFKETR